MNQDFIIGKFYTDIERYEYCKKYKISGLKLSEYARRNNLNRSAFKDWVNAYNIINGKFINVSNVIFNEGELIETEAIPLKILFILNFLEEYDVAIRKIDSAEINFIVVNSKERMYIQITEIMMDEEMKKRELNPLLKIKDNYEKIVLTLDRVQDELYDGIKILNIIEWHL